MGHDGIYESQVADPLAAQSTFPGMEPEDRPLPSFAEVRDLLPAPSWDGHDDAVACYWKAWELAFRNLRRPAPGSGFVANFIDTAFNDNLFMWDSAFILLFARYGIRAFDFQRTLDNFYAKQKPDGFICREIRESDGRDLWQRYDPSATGPNIMPWTEWEYYLSTGDRGRLARVYPPLAAFHGWMRRWRTWPDGSYWANGLSCGMDNQPRIPLSESPWHNHGHLSWVDTCFQQLFSADLLGRMARVLGRPAEESVFREEHGRLAAFVNGKMWSDRTAFYHDRRGDGTLDGAKSVGAYWALVADAVPRDRLDPFIAHLENPAEFNRPHRVPSLSADHAEYRADGGYWLGASWPPTTYMVLRGLVRAGREKLAREIALNHHANVVSVFRETGTLFENYAPESAAPGNPSRRDFVGWGGLGPVAVFLEYVLGLVPDVPAGRLTWNVSLVEKHGVSRYPFAGGGIVDLACEARNSPDEKPVIRATSSAPLDLVLRWDGGEQTMRLG